MSSKIAKTVTDTVISLLEQGTVPWEKPWDSTQGMMRNAVTGKEYRGSNQFMLNIHALQFNCNSNYWATPKQVNDIGGSIARGAKMGWVTFWKPWTAPHDDAKCLQDDKGNCICDDRVVWIIRAYKVVNLSQTTGLSQYDPPGERDRQKKARNNKPIDSAESIVKGYKDAPTVRHGGSVACYQPSIDKVSMPDKQAFKGMEEYYSTLFHEFTHSTGHESRLNRKGITACTTFGTPEYSREELIAEMGAAMLSMTCGISHKTLNNSASYIASWIKVLKRDPKAVLVAGSAAHKAIDYILGTSD